MVYTMNVTERDSDNSIPLYVRIGTEHYQRTGIAPGPSPRGTVVEVVPADLHRGAVDAAARATALAERYGEAIVAISAALPNENRVRAIIASLDAGGQ